MKYTLALSILVYLSTILSTVAQEDNYYEESPTYKGSALSGLKVGLNAQLVLPLNALARQNFSGGTGVGIFAKYIFAGKVGVGGLFNYNILSARQATVGQTNSLMMYGASLEYYMNKAKVTPYFGMDICDYRFTGESNLNVGGANQSFTYNYFLFSGWGVAPNIGFIYDFSERVSTTINFKYNHIFPRDLAGVNPQLLMISASVFYNIGEL